jgi:translation initiation factor IF-3
MADDRGLDLVEVAPDADPPVCRIMDFGKYRYEQTKKEKVSRKHQHSVRAKEIRLHPNIERHDLEIKEKQARQFLEGGHKVKLSVRFRGRQMAHPEFGHEVLNEIVERVKDVGAVEMRPKMMGRSMTLVIGPLKSR